MADDELHTPIEALEWAVEELEHADADNLWAEGTLKSIYWDRNLKAARAFLAVPRPEGLDVADLAALLRTVAPLLFTGPYAKVPEVLAENLIAAGVRLPDTGDTTKEPK